MPATTLTYLGPSIEDTGDIWSTLAGLFGGNAPGPANQTTLNGSTIGSLGGAALATSLGAPYLAPIAAGLGGALGGLAENAVKPKPRATTPKPKATLSANQKRILEQGQAQSKRTGNPAFFQEAQLRVYRPAEYQRRRTLGRLPTQLVQVQTTQATTPAQPAPPKQAPAKPQPQRAPSPPPASPTASPPARPRIDLSALFEGLSGAEQARLQLAIQEGRGAETWKEIQESRRVPAPAPVLPEQSPFEEIDGPAAEEMDGYSETSGPPEARPKPRKHLAILPLNQAQLEALLRAVPALQKLDKRLLRLLAGRSSVARDVSGVDPSRGTYTAQIGETPYGIAKKLTGDPNRVAELMAANPGNAGPIWQIPPGWLAYEPDTGAITTARRYTVVQNDTPYGIAKKFGALAIRPKWWSELRAANPDKPTKDNGGNWESLYANEVIGIPDAWPSVQLPNVTNNGGLQQGPNTNSGPGLPSPQQQSTQDPGTYLQAQAMLGLWAKANAGACVPADFGATPTDFSGTATARTTSALTSFQTWWNKTRPSSQLRTDGTLDEPTYRALYTATVAQVPAPAPEQPKPAPTPTPAPSIPGGLQFPQLPDLPPWLSGGLGGAPQQTPNPQQPQQQPQQAPAPQLPQAPPGLSGWFGGGITANPPIFIPTTSTIPALPPWLNAPVIAAPSPAPTPSPAPSTSSSDDGPALPILTVLGGLLMS